MKTTDQLEPNIFVIFGGAGGARIRLANWLGRK